MEAPQPRCFFHSPGGGETVDPIEKKKELRRKAMKLPLSPGGLFNA